MEDCVLLEWTFTPPDYFEEGIFIERENHTMKIEAGKAEARIDPVVYAAEQDMRETLHEVLNDRFLAVQLLTHKSFQLSKPTMYRLHPDGRRDVTVIPEPAVMTLKGGIVDVTVKDKDGNVISDSRRERIEKKQSLADLVEKYRPHDKLLASMLASHHAAVHDPANELVHLYEIREALATHFGGEAKVRAILPISASDWSRLGQLANDQPLRQGRHRGKRIGELRDANETEIKEVRRIALVMIEAYLNYLENQQ